MFKELKTVLNKKNLHLDILTVVFIFFAVIIIFLPVMMQWQGIFHDDLGMSEFPIQYSLASNLQRSIMPLWDPYTWCGAVPFNYKLIYAGGNYYPLWLFYLFADLSSFDKAYWMITILPLFMHYILSAIGMFVLLKQVVKCSRIPAVIGALIYIYSPVFSYLYGSTASLVMLSWLPWLIYIYVKTVENWRLWKLFLGGIIFSFIWIAGRPHFMPFIMIIWGSVGLSSVIDNLHRGRKKSFIKPLLVAFLIFILGSGLAAVFLVPSLDVAKYTQFYTELSVNSAFSDTSGNLSLPYLATLFAPNLFGSITGRNFIFRHLIFCEANMTGGMATTLMVILGVLMPFLAFRQKEKNKIYRRFAITGIFLYLFSIVCALGANSLFYRLAVGWIPIVGGLPFPIRYRLIQCFAASMLIAIGLNCLFTFQLPIKRYGLKKPVLLYIFFSFFVIAIVLFFPLDWHREDLWWGSHDSGIKGFLSLKEPFGLYTPRIGRVKKIRIMFDGESRGEIRYSDNHRVLPDKGILAKSYYSAGEGWSEFEVDIPPNKFLWIHPKSGCGSFAYWNEKECSSFSFSDKWIGQPDINAISIYRKIKKRKSSLFYELKNGQIVKRPVVTSVVYLLLVSLLMIAGVYIFSPEKFGYFLGCIILIEVFSFGMLAFYKTTFTHLAPSPEHFRYLRPSDHPMLQRMVTQLPSVAPDPGLRIATADPYYDTFVYLNELNCRFALMGYGICPLEKRFKHAIEAAYGQAMDYGIYQEPCFPASPAFLNNFSIGYFMSMDINSEKIFPGEKVVPLKGESNCLVHINPDVLPRVYTIDKVIPIPENEQFEKLVFGDLRKAAYISINEEVSIEKETGTDYVSYFKSLQLTNSISDIDFSNPNRIEVDIDVKVPAMLVLTEVWYPGWRATVDGEQTKIYRVNYCQRGIWLDKGSHHIELEFRSLAWRVGVGISLGTIILMMSSLICIRTKKKNA